MRVPPTAMHLVKISSPREAYLMGPKPLLDQASQARTLERGRESYFTFQGVGNVPVHEIKVGDGTIFEIEQTVAVNIVERLGLELGSEGLPLQVLEGA